jgi:[ribosomal protein S5]-alanine N-acetyltransferase
MSANGESCKLRAFAQTDAQRILELLSDPNVYEPLALGKGCWPLDLPRAHALMEKASTCRSELALALEVEREAAGAIVFEPLQTPYEGTANVSYWLGRSYWGKGIMTSALGVATCYAFQKRGISRIEARTVPENRRSIRVLEKAGYVQEACLRHRISLQGMRVDELVFGIWHDDWTRKDHDSGPPLFGLDL